MNPIRDIDRFLARAEVGLERFRLLGVPHVAILAPNRDIAEAAVPYLHNAGFIVEGISDTPCSVRVKIPAARMPEDPAAEHGRCAHHGAPLQRRLASAAPAGMLYCSVGGPMTSVWTEAAGSC